MHLVPLRGKTPNLGKDWPNQPSVTWDDIRNGSHNVGINLHRSNIVDVDIDDPKLESVILEFLPTTAAFGYNNRIRHLFFRGQYEHITFKHPQSNETLLEIRAGPAKQTMIPPSVHPELNVALEWYRPSESIIPWTDDFEAACRLAVAARVLSELWGGPGERHDKVLGLIGFLFKCKLTETEVEKIVLAAALMADDPDPEDRLKAIATTAQRHKDNQSIRSSLGNPTYERYLQKLLTGVELPIFNLAAYGTSAELITELTRALRDSGRIFRYLGEPHFDAMTRDKETLRAITTPEVYKMLIIPSILQVEGTISKDLCRVLLKNMTAIDYPEVYAFSSRPTIHSLEHPKLEVKDDYYPASKIYQLPNNGFTPVHVSPSASASFLLDVFKDFTFAENTRPKAEAIILANIIGGTIRHLIPTSPITIIASMQKGVGKDLLSETISLMVTNAPDYKLEPTLLSRAGEGEWANGILSALEAETPFATFSNCNGMSIGNSKLDVLLSQATYTGRQTYGRRVKVQNKKCFFVNGNNMALNSDIKRRMMLIRLVATTSVPWMRDLPDIRRYVHDHYPEILGHIANIIENVKPADAGSFASFEEWDRQVRQRVMALGYVDPVFNEEEDASEIEDMSPNAAIEKLMGLMDPAKEYSIGEILQLVEDSDAQEAHEVKDSFNYMQGVDHINRTRLGMFLGRFVGVVIHGDWTLTRRKLEGYTRFRKKKL